MARLLAFVAILCPCMVGGAAEPPVKVDKLDELIQKLGDPDFATREAASKKLYDGGIEALPAIRQAAKNPNPEISRRAAPILRRLEVLASLQPKRVSLKPGDRSLSQAMDELRQQTGYGIVAEAPKTTPLLHYVSLNELTYWEAVERLSARWGRGLQTSRFGRDASIAEDRPHARFVSLDGPFRIELTKIHEDRDIDFTLPGNPAKNPGSRKSTATFEVLAEPRFIILQADTPRLRMAVDHHGGKMTPVPAKKDATEKSIRLDELLRADYHWTSETVFLRPNSRSDSLKTLQGTIPLSVVVERKKKVLTDHVVGSTGSEFRVGPDVIKIQRSEQTQDGSLYLSLGIPPPAGGIGIKQWHQRVSVEDKDGHTLEPSGHGSGRSGREYSISIYFPSRKPTDPQPARLVVEEWTVVPYPVAFEFTDVPLP